MVVNVGPNGPRTGISICTWTWRIGNADREKEVEIGGDTRMVETEVGGRIRPPL